MYAIKLTDYSSQDKLFLVRQCEQYTTMKEDNFRVMMKFNDPKDHPFLFDSEEDAITLCNEIEKRSHKRYTVVKYTLPKEYHRHECEKCNKKNKLHCMHLANQYQNLCAFGIAKFPKDFKLDKKRLDTPCESCKNADCLFQMYR